MTLEIFEQQFGFAGVERTVAAEPLTGNFICIIPQEDVTISAIDVSPGFTSTNYTDETLAKGIPFYIPFTSVTLTGKADCYKTIYNRKNHKKLQ